MNEELKKKMDLWFYYLIKGAAMQSYADFLSENCDLSHEEYETMSAYIEEKLGIELYI